eukprot:Mrub_09530.p1 GENE.Mrub_09530~~Mrub_09530.p1  ORF type:complete len:230 (-),score=26.95 Mrub_09530:56-679(-)
MKELVRLNHRLTKEERNLFSLGYKYRLNYYRNSYRLLLDIDKKFEHTSFLNEFMSQTRLSMKELCSEVIDLLHDEIIPKETDVESKVYYLKMLGDYSRYLSEVELNENCDVYKNMADEKYSEAKLLCENNNFIGNVIYIGLILNYSVFLYEILNLKDQARQMAEKAMETTYNYLENPDNKNYTDQGDDQDILNILRLVEDNLYNWRN